MARVARAALPARAEGRSCWLPSLNDDHEELVVEGDEHFVPFRADPKVPQFVLRRVRECEISPNEVDWRPTDGTLTFGFRSRTTLRAFQARCRMCTAYCSATSCVGEKKVSSKPAVNGRRVRPRRPAALSESGAALGPACCR